MLQHAVALSLRRATRGALARFVCTRSGVLGASGAADIVVCFFGGGSNGGGPGKGCDEVFSVLGALRRAGVFASLVWGGLVWVVGPVWGGGFSMTLGLCGVSRRRPSLLALALG